MPLPGPKSLLGQYGLRPKHSFGQNFLGDVHHAEHIARLAAPAGRERVLELGAGLGALSDRLLARGCSVVLVERDRDLIPALSEIFSQAISEGRAEVVEADAKMADWQTLLGEVEHRVVAGNLPYQITGPLLSKTTQLRHVIERAVFLVQKEVADRLVATPGGKEYGALSVFVQAQFSVTRPFTLKPGAFYPSPRVESAVCVLVPHTVPIAEETPLFRMLVRSAFGARRKTLRNAWKSIAASDVLAAAAETRGISLEVRGETLSATQFADMASELQKIQSASATVDRRKTGNRSGRVDRGRRTQ